MAIWDDIIPEQEREKYSSGGMGVSLSGFGKKPALLIVDMSYCFADGDKYLLGDSSVGWPCVQNIGKLLKVARAKKVPVFYSTSEWRDNPVERGLWKRSEAVNKALALPRAYEIVDEIKPLPNEPVVVKFAPSAFHGTNLLNMLIQHNVDTLIVTGMVTSGCVYATVVDGFSYGFKTIVPVECAADRSQISHKVSLFNIHMKYGDVLPSAEVEKYLSEL